MSIIGIRVYRHFFVGFIRISKYSGLGSLRAIIQRVSYEVIFFFVLFCLIIIYLTFRRLLIFGFYLLILSFLFFLLVLAEVGRAPFDFTEGERELVRGYNLEYRSLIFIFLFLSEYGMLVLFRILLSRVFFI